MGFFNIIVFRLFYNSRIIANEGSFALGRVHKVEMCPECSEDGEFSHTFLFECLPFADHGSSSWDLRLELFLEGAGKEQDADQTQSPCNQ